MPLPKRSLHCIWILAVLLCASVLSGQTLSAQTPITLHGSVTDAAGSAVSAIQITLLRAGTPVAHTLSSPSGGFQLGPLAPGTYRLSIPAFNGLAAQDITLKLAKSTRPLTITLAPATVVENVQVNAGDTLSTAAADNKDTIAISGSSIDDLPVFDQNPIATLTPFLDPDTTSNGGVSIIVDGVELKGATVTPSAIASLQINRDPYSAEFSSPGLGRIEITTKPGSPQFHGTFNFIFRDSSLNGRNFFAPVRAPEQRRIYEGNLTGPVGRGGHTTFLVSSTQREEDLQSAVHAVGPPNQFGFDSAGNLSQNVATPNRHTQINGHVTHDFSETHRINLGYNFEQVVRQNRNVGGTVLPVAGYNNNSREDDIIINDRLILTPNLIQQLAIVAEKDEYVSSSVTHAPAIIVSGSFTAGGAQQSDFSTTENTLHLTDIVSWTHGRHYLRFGVSNPLQLSRRAQDNHSNRLGTFNFNSVQDFQNNAPYQFNIDRGPGRATFWFNPLDGFVQDEISLRKNLQLTLGLRYQWQTYLSDLHNFAPRLSFAYSPSPRWVVRVGSGIFYDHFGGDFAGSFRLFNGTNLREIQLLNPSYPNALQPGQDFSAFPTNIVRESPTLQAPLLVQYSATLERQFGKSLTATATYRGMTGTHTFRSRDANAPLPPFYTLRPDPSVGFVQQVESEGRSRLNALDLGLHGRIGSWFTGQAQYTFAHSNNNTGGINWFPQDQYNPSAEWGRSIYDRHHRLNLLGTIRPDHWLSLGLAANLYSGAPYNELAGSDFFHTGLGNARPAGVARNTLQGSGRINLDLSWNHSLYLNRKQAKDGRVLNFGISAFNVLNHTNFPVDYIGNIRSPLFGHPVTALPARQIQFQLRYQF